MKEKVGKSSLAVLLIILGAFILLYGANVFPMQMTFQSYTVEGKGYKVTVSRYADRREQTIHLDIVRSKSEAYRSWIYVWVYREVRFKRYNEESNKWEYATGYAVLYGRGGSRKVYPRSSSGDFYTYSYDVNFETAMSSWTGYFTGWQFDEWGNIGKISVNGKVWVEVDLTAIQNIPVKQKVEASSTEPIPPEVSPPAAEPESSATLNIGGKEASPQLQMLGAGMVIAGLALMAMKKRQR